MALVSVVVPNPKLFTQGDARAASSFETSGTSSRCELQVALNVARRPKKKTSSSSTADHISLLLFFIFIFDILLLSPT